MDWAIVVKYPDETQRVDKILLEDMNQTEGDWGRFVGS